VRRRRCGCRLSERNSPGPSLSPTIDVGAADAAAMAALGGGISDRDPRRELLARGTAGWLVDPRPLVVR
jgi:hypothetical protein